MTDDNGSRPPMKFRDLPRAARVFIVAVIAAGAALAVWSALHGAFDHLLMFLPLMAAAIIFNTVKIELTGSSSTFSIGYAVSFASLLLLGSPGAIWIAIAGAWAQCSFNMKLRNPWYQTAFSVSVLALSMGAAGVVLRWTRGGGGGRPPRHPHPPVHGPPPPAPLSPTR